MPLGERLVLTSGASRGVLGVAAVVWVSACGNSQVRSHTSMEVDSALPQSGSSSTCMATSCAALHATCGQVPDGCGNMLTCGTCSAPQTCGGGGQPNVCGSASAQGLLPYRGVSMAGAEFSAGVGGLFSGNTLGTMPGGYYYPTTDLAKGGPPWPVAANGTAIETDLMDPYFRGKGMNTVRLPLRWEHLQHSLAMTSSAVLTGPQVVATFDQPELTALKLSVTTLTSAGFTVLIDIHNYAAYTNAAEVASNKGGDPLGSANVPNIAFENLWIGLASLYANNTQVVFDIMNEPNTPPDPQGKPPGYEWYLAAQAAVSGIRGAGANNLILICGNQFANPGAFASGGWSDPLKSIQDPGNNFAFEIHDYPDTAYGTSDTCTAASVQTVMGALQTFLSWATQYKVRGFLGEFSAGIDVNANPLCITGTSQMLTFLEQNPTTFIGWTYWAAGAGFGPNNSMNHALYNPGQDSPQIKALAPFLQ